MPHTHQPNLAVVVKVSISRSGIISLEGLRDVLREKSPESDITPQALSKKINSDKAVSFLERTFEAIYKEQVCPKLEKIPFAVLEQFSNVYPPG
ncbi:hypothetical protein KSMBR1_2896 [Candidatus Kuenenia stuttgartiensis]|uniref:Uncharacterized protein n=1 Tax=Kuenenia stuttgartiensis TaxID=174633 RepID=A0A2C9CKR3_KUEST|nr:hypothetical protein KSMBR1_2896 [Candidatus Kuenenia stuttgartiensis]